MSKLPPSYPSHSSNFEEIVDAYYEALYRFALSLSKNECDASDLTQQAFLRFADKGHQIRDINKVKSWLFTSLYRDYLNQRRRHTRFPHVSLDHSESQFTPVSLPSEGRNIDAELLMNHLQEMDDKYRIPLTLFYLQHHSYAEIAALLDVPIGTVMSRLSRAKQLLKTRFTTADSKASNILTLKFKQSSA